MAKKNPIKWNDLRKKKFNASKRLTGAKSYNAKVDERIRAKAMYLESNGKVKLVAIAKAVGVTAETITNWKKEGNWDAECEIVQTTIQSKLNEKLLCSRDVRSLLDDVTEDQLTSAVELLVGRSVSAAVSDFLAKVHTQDIKDLDAINRAIRLHLREGKIDDLSTSDINNLVTAKSNIVKTVRLIFGKSTENVDDNREPTKIEITLDKDQAESIKTIQTLEVGDTTLVVQG